MELLPLKCTGLRLRQLYMAPGITAHIDKVEEYIVAFSFLALYRKFEAICDKLAMPSLCDPILGLEAQLSLKFINVAPVLSALALLQMGRLNCHTAVNVIKVARTSPHHFTPGETVNSEILPTALLVTWAI
ncbi:hypothetical protein A1O3_09223 [Capronia epimyces CBS 606.96]|uniref:Uncharacterized protein n=1 Tax=Capronia epimyces CBS 606.96 TaxID=1182542 RepID=W9XC50_9EURO|nr:uncharacterized protein A1O3_09223 [Capronia epimyces CBS 606.96]EXJ78062.1 hypothetical protein A1O3_09223 [Capronia epimyces CBS 606.96]